MTVTNNEIYKRLSTPEAEHLAELYLLQGDLNTAYDTLTLYFKKYAATDRPKDGQASIISPSLFRDGLLLFCSCFDKTANPRLDPAEVYTPLGADKVEYAQKLIDMRDSFIAHSFGPQRQHGIVILCTPIEGRLFPEAFTQYFVRFSGWVERERNTLLPFIDVARKHLNRLIEAAETLVMLQLQEISSEELMALPDAEVVLPDPKDYRSGRSSFRKSGRGSRTPVPQRRLGRTIIATP